MNAKFHLSTLIGIIILILTGWLPLTATAANKIGDLFYNLNDNGTAEVTWEGIPNYVSGEVVIPSEIIYNGKTYEVTAIGIRAFDSSTDITSVIIPESVVSIGNEAFYGCNNLTSILIPNSVETIGVRAFHNCKGLTSLNLGESVTSIYENAFDYCENLTSINLGNNVVTIGDYAFNFCINLKSINIPSTVISIGKNTFYGCNSLGAINVNENNIIYSSIDGVLYSKAMTELIKCPYAYAPNNGYYECPSSVTSICTGALQFCRNLTFISIGSAVVTIGDEALAYCANLTSLYCKATEPPQLNNSIDQNTYSNTILYVPQNSINSYLYASGWKNFVNIKAKDLIVEDLDFFIYGGLRYQVVDYETHTCKVSLNTLASGNIIIPEEVLYDNSKYKVTTIDNNAFGDCINLNTISISNSVTSIGNGAFSGCRGLTSVEIPNSVTAIGEDAFSGCSGLTSVEIPNSVTSIGDYAFWRCSGLTSVEIPNSVTAIGNYAFYGCSGMTSVIIGSSVNSIGNKAFYGCANLKKSAYPKTLKNNPFSAGTSVAYNPEGAIIEDCWIYGPEKTEIRFAPYTLEGEFTIPNSVTSIGNDAFSGCSSLTSVIAPENVPVIDDTTFSGSYESCILSVPESSLLDYLSSPWSLFKNINVSGKSLLSYDDGVFTYRLIPDNQTAVITGRVGTSINVDIPERFTYENGEERARYQVVAVGYKAIHDQKLNSLTFNSRSQLKQIGDNAFAGNNFDSVILPGTVETIGNYAFANCKSLQSVELNDALQSIGNSAFENCSSLCYVDLSNTALQTIDKQTFCGCTSLYSVKFNNTILSIEDGAFKGSGLKTVTFNEALQSIGNSAFSECAGLTSVEFNEALQSIGNSAFSRCTYINKLKFGNKLETIGNAAFSNCTNLRSVEIPGSVMSLGNDAFSTCANLGDVTIDYSSECLQIGSNFGYMTSLKLERVLSDYSNIPYSLKTLVIGNNIEEIPEAAFSNKSLTSLTLGSSMISIADDAFSNNSIRSVILPPVLESIGASAFADNTKLSTIIMGSNVKTIGEQAFYNCPATSIYITAQIPPAAPNNAFSSYSGNLYLQGKDAVDAYYDAWTCWDRFNGYEMIEPTSVKYEGPETVTGTPGDTFQVSATLLPENVTLPHFFWHSTNPLIATVDQDGLVTLHHDINQAVALADEYDENVTAKCKIIGESLYANGPIVEVDVVNNTITAINELFNSEPNGDIDYNAPYTVYNLNGIYVGESRENLAPGIYIVRQSEEANKMSKIIVK